MSTSEWTSGTRSALNGDGWYQLPEELEITVQLGATELLSSLLAFGSQNCCMWHSGWHSGYCLDLSATFSASLALRPPYLDHLKYRYARVSTLKAICHRSYHLQQSGESFLLWLPLSDILIQILLTLFIEP